MHETHEKIDTRYLEGGEKTPKEIRAALLFVDIEDSVSISEILGLKEYDYVIDKFQRLAANVVDSFEKDIKNYISFVNNIPHKIIIEKDVRGDQFCTFIYDSFEIERNSIIESGNYPSNTKRIEIIDQCRRMNSFITFLATKLGFLLKQRWIVSEPNIIRVNQDRLPYELAIGIHYGRVVRSGRAWGGVRVEGHSIGVAKRVEEFARQGNHSRILISKQAYDQLRRFRIGRYLIEQLVDFNRSTIMRGKIAGLRNGLTLYELVSVITIGKELGDLGSNQIKTLINIAHMDHSYLWIILQVLEYLLFVKLGEGSADDEDKEHLRRLIEIANHYYYDDPRIMCFMAHYELQRRNEPRAIEILKEVIKSHPKFDYAIRKLAELTTDEEEKLSLLSEVIRHLPLSPLNNYLYARNLAALNRISSQIVISFFERARDLFPDYPRHTATKEELKVLVRKSIDPDLKNYLLKNWILNEANC